MRKDGPGTDGARRAMSVFSPNWPITRLRRRMGASWPAAPEGVATMAMEKSARRLQAVDERAAALGAAPGQTVADAVALVPGLVILDAEPEEDLRALERLADWCERFSPAVAVDPPDGLFLDVAGCAHLWGGERGMAEMIRERLAAEGIPVRVAIAPTFAAAWALARYGGEEVAILGEEAVYVETDTPDEARSVTDWMDETELKLPTANTARRTLMIHLPSPLWGGAGGGGRRGPCMAQTSPELGGGANPTTEVLLTLPVAALRLEPGVSDHLVVLGLKTIGDVLALPRAALRKRLGDELTLRLAQVFGETDEPLAFRRPPRPFLARRVFAEPLSAPEDFLRVVSALADELCGRLGGKGLGARGFELAFHRVDGTAARREIALSLPARDPRRLAALFAPKLESVDPGFGIEVAVLIAHTVEPTTVAQTDLVEAARDARDADLAPLIDRLRNRLGADRVWRAVPHASHVPERAVARAAPLAPAEGAAWPEGQPRPVRLFSRPEPIEAIAPVPDDPPVMFRWRGRRRRIVRAEGPERIGAEWWRAPWAEAQGEGGVDRVRDYYRLEDETGARFWAFRTGLYGSARGTKWWLHGVFA